MPDSDQTYVRPPQFDLEGHWLTHPKGADVEIVEPWTELTGDNAVPDTLPCIKPRLVRVNGVDVGLIARDGIEVDPGSSEHPASVTIKLFPRSVTIKAE